MSREPIRLTIEEVEAWRNLAISGSLTDGEAEFYARAMYFAKQLLNTMRENERLRNAIGNIEPLQDIDWHGKWRIRKCLDALPNKESE